MTSLAERAVHPVSLIGHEGPLDWKLDGEGLHVTLPTTRPCEHAFVLKIE